jgi:hypothetical protein
MAEARTLKTLSLVVVLLAGIGGAYARDLPSGGLSNQDVVGWLTQHGDAASISAFQGATMIDARFPGIPADLPGEIDMYECNDKGCPELQYYQVFRGGSDITLDKVNEWNKLHRYLRAYLKPSGTVEAEYDVDISPGGTWEQLDHSLDRWNDELSKFRAFMNR